MKLKNYTTEVPASRSIEAIEKLLIEFGATNINKQYENGQCSGIIFLITVENMHLPFRLPAKVDKIYNWLKKQKPNSADKTLRDQAPRIAWKQLHEWVHLQLGMIEMDQAEKLELFFAHLYNAPENKTYYEQIKEGNFKALLPGS